MLYGNPNVVFDELKKELSIENYKKVIELYQFYKEKYKYYL